MNFEQYTLTKSFKAPKTALDSNGILNYRRFKEGENVKGYVREQKKNLTPAIITEDEYIVPLTHVRKIEMAFDGRPPIDSIENTMGSIPFSKTKLPISFQAKMDEIKNMDIGKNIIQPIKSSKNHMFWGGAAGLTFALLSKRNIILWTLVGSVAGIYIGKALNSKQTINKTKI